MNVLRKLFPLLPLFFSPTFLQAQGTQFTYQGRLMANGALTDGTYNLRLQIYDAASAGNVIAGPITNSAVVSNGLFTTTLDFGAGVFTGANRWLEIGVRTNGAGTFTNLSPRQALTATPYAILAGNVSGVVSNASLAGTYGNAVTFNNPANSFTGNGGGLTNLPAANLSGVVSAASLSNAWKLTGNTATIPATHFLGTTDNNPLNLRVNNLRALRLEPRADGPNIIGGFQANTVSNGVNGATISGGGGFGGIETNIISDDYGVIGGGGDNIAGSQNAMTTDASYATIGGGNNNRARSFLSTIGGGAFNSVGLGAPSTTIGGGESNSVGDNSDTSTIGGGANNLIGASAFAASISGGERNTIESSGIWAVISGGWSNRIQLNGQSSTIGGGRENTIGAAAQNAVIAGGSGNLIQSNSLGVAIGGGYFNTVQSNTSVATINGGQNNTIQKTANYSAIGGGLSNTIQSNSANAVISGGGNNLITGSFASISGGDLNNATANSFAAGHRAKANHIGSFVWGDSTDADWPTTGNNQFLMRASGGVGIGATNVTGALFIRQPTGVPSAGMNAADNGLGLGQVSTSGYKWIQSYGGSLILNPLQNNVGINKTNPATALDVNGTVTATAFNPPSDRNLKENFATINAREVLDKVTGLTITRWNFKGDASTPHVGPMAQDFHAAFGLGTDERHIATVDADGVALAAIQGLNEKVERGKQKAEIQIENLEKENADLKQRLEVLEKIIRNQKVN